MLKTIMGWFRKVEATEPVPGKDAQWIGYCEGCDEYELQVSRGGFRNGGVVHCYHCGREKEASGYKQEDIDRMVLSCRFHWQKYPAYPYNWHTLTEEQKWEILGKGAR